MNIQTAKVLVAALLLLNSKPRFGPSNRRIAIDSYSVAFDIQQVLKANGWDWQDPQLQPPLN